VVNGLPRLDALSFEWSRIVLMGPCATVNVNADMDQHFAIDPVVYSCLRVRWGWSERRMSYMSQGRIRTRSCAVDRLARRHKPPQQSVKFLCKVPNPSSTAAPAF
jgi:hypothetical protein